MVMLVMCNLVDGDNFSIAGEHHHSKHKRGYFLHRIHVATPKKDIVIKWSIDKFNVNEDSFSPEFDVDILEDPFRG
jgi:hypothetical protein